MARWRNGPMAQFFNASILIFQPLQQYEAARRSLFSRRKHPNDLHQRPQKFQQRSGIRLRFIDVNLVPAAVDHGNLGTQNRVACLHLLMQGSEAARL